MELETKHGIVRCASVWICDAINVSRECQPIPNSDVLELAADIQKHGQNERVGVVLLHDVPWLDLNEHAKLMAQGYRYALVYGFRRMRALAVAGIETVKIELRTGIATRDAIEMANLAENWGHKPPTDYQLTWAVHRMIQVHKQDVAAVAKRINRRPSWVLESVAIMDHVRPDLLAHYRVASTPDVRRKMAMLAQVESPLRTPGDRHRLQGEAWDQWEAADAAAIRADPQGGVRPTPPNRARAAERNTLRAKLRAVLDDPRYTDEQRLFRIRAMVGR